MFDTEKFICEVEQSPPLYDVQSKDYSNREIKAKCWAEIGEAMYDDWNSISVAAKDMRGKDLIKKWKAIRDNFVKDHKLVTLTETGKPANKRKRNVYYDQLQFLLPYIRGNVSTSSNIEPLTESEVDTEEPHDIHSQTIIGDTQQNDIPTKIVPTTSTASTAVGPTKKKPGNEQSRVSKKAAIEKVAASANDLKSILLESLAIQKEEREADIYGHRAFLMSFVPLLNRLPLDAAMQARLHVSQIFTRIHSQSIGYQWRLQREDIDDATTGYSSNSTSAPPAPASYQTDSSQDFNISDYINLE